MAQNNESQLSMFHERDTLQDAKIIIANKIQEGINCPCCGQYCREYRFGLSEKAAMLLLNLCRATLITGDEFIHIDRLADISKIKIKGGTSFSILSWWGLIEERQNFNEEKKTSGFWKPTELGWQFARGKTKIKEYAYTFDGTIRHRENDKDISIKDLRWKRFDYSELMSWMGDFGG